MLRKAVVCLMLTVRVGAQPAHDAAGPFLEFWREHGHQTEQRRVASFMEEVYPKARVVYDMLFDFSASQGEDRTQRIQEHLKEFPKIEARYRELYTQIKADLPQRIANFKVTFPDFQPESVDLYLLHSLGGSNGALFPHEGRWIFYLGLDMMVRFNDYPDQKAFFDHEFFHAYHAQFFSIKPEFYSYLWFEGLAVYAATRMNPQATPAELQIPDPMMPEVEQRLAFLLADVERNLENTDPAFRNRYTYYLSQDEQVPTRAGYYLGFLIVQAIADGRSLVQLAHLSHEQVLAELRRGIAKLRARVGST